MVSKKSTHRRVSPKFAKYLDNVKDNYSRKLKLNISSADASDIILRKLNRKKRKKGKDDIFMQL